jgi:hypothetical protein
MKQYIGIHTYIFTHTHTYTHTNLQGLEPHAWVRLYSLLSRVLLRSSKDDMEKMGTIPTCHVYTSFLQLSNSERRAYNGLISIIKRNLILAGGGGSNVDSLLHAKNRKFATEVMFECMCVYLCVCIHVVMSRNGSPEVLLWYMYIYVYIYTYIRCI